MARKLYLDRELTYIYVKFFYPDKSLRCNHGGMGYPDIDYITPDLVLFPLLYGCRREEMILQALLSHALNLRGIRSRFVLCDRKLPACISQTVKAPANCYYCHYMGKKFASDLGMPVNWFGDFITNRDATDASEYVSSLNPDEYYDLDYKGINVGQYAEAATKRFLQTGAIDNKEFDMHSFGKYLASAILHVELSKRILARIKPTRIIVNNIAYLPGVFIEYFNKKGVKCITCDFGTVKDAVNLNRIDHERRELFQISSKTWKKYSSRMLSDIQKKELEGILTSRVNGVGMQLDHGRFTRIKSREEIVNSLDIDVEKNTGILFTNLPWDSSLAGVDVVFKNPFEWIHETMNWFAHRTEKLLIIKVHPAEELRGTQFSILSYIHSKFPELPENIRVLSPKSEISTYSLFDVADYGVAYTSTAGLEMALNGIPVITTAQNHYRGKGFTFDAADREGYLDLLENSGKLQMTPKMRGLAEKYGYLHFCDREIRFKFIEFGGENFTSPKLKLKDWHELLPGSDENLDKICDGILHDKEFLRSYSG